MTPLERFESKVLKTDSCWLWQAGRFTKGYGSFWLNGRSWTAHHAAYEFYIGPVPSGLIVCHSCDVRLCVRPEHLFLGTDQDNADDREAKGRTFRTWAPAALVAAKDLRSRGLSIAKVSALVGVPAITLERKLR